MFNLFQDSFENLYNAHLGQELAVCYNLFQSALVFIKDVLVSNSS